MRLGATYIVFSGLDLLKPSILNIRQFAQHLVVVWSRISSTGEQAPKYMEPLLNDLVSQRLVDQLVEFKPKITRLPIRMQDNCRMKREVGRIVCQTAGCTHHIIRDCDEFYEPLQFADSIKEFSKYDSTIAPIYDYIGSPTKRTKQVASLHVPVVQRIDRKLSRHNPFGVTVDLGRTIEEPVDTFKIFKPSELVLHHFTYVRCNSTELRRKYQGHGHLHRIGDIHKFMSTAKSWPKDDLVDVPDQFGILDYWKGEFQQWLSIDRN